MNQTEGDSNFTAHVLLPQQSLVIANKYRPPLKVAPVFGGIAGLMATEQGEPDDVGHIPSISTKTREMSKLQDMYRQTLAASWAAQTGELSADKCVEEIFAGGDGWGNINNDAASGLNHPKGSTEGNESDGDGRTVREHRRSSSGYEHRHPTPLSHRRMGSRGSDHDGGHGGVSGRGSIEQQLQSSNIEGDRSSFMRPRMHEVDEFSIREDLRSWKSSTRS